ncbi:MAG: amidophosphoribosyltransferase [Candidatus Nezhaarchaeota archaeon]|nr:amidophosphoribosyltransferase [Candidatus Nezhaarchaeota archaeon]
MKGARERCGVVGAYSKQGSVALDIYKALFALQHRGQESAGIYLASHRGLEGFKGLGFVHEALGGKVEALEGSCGVGHVRYSTTASSSLEEAQPLLYEVCGRSFAIAFNGTISNYLGLRRLLEAEGLRFKTLTDTEVLAASLAKGLREGGWDYVEAIKLAMPSLEGAYSLVVLSHDGELYAARDPLGFKPLCLGLSEERELYVAASETCALDTLSCRLLCHVEPGMVVRVYDGGVEAKKLASSHRHARCMFEYVYFSRPDSEFDGVWVYEARYGIGRELGSRFPAEADVVVPVPDSGRTAALGYSEATGLPLVEGLMKNRYVGRIFIMPEERYRNEMVKVKLNPVKPLVKGRRVVLIDDSIVRGTTMRHIVRLLRGAGAKEVHVRISCPPIVAGCYMGIDFPTRRELIASCRSVEEVRAAIEADSLQYNTIDGLVKGIGLTYNELCLACLTGEYPIKADVSLLELEIGGLRRR